MKTQWVLHMSKSRCHVKRTVATMLAHTVVRPLKTLHIAYPNIQRPCNTLWVSHTGRVSRVHMSQIPNWVKYTSMLARLFLLPFFLEWSISNMYEFANKPSNITTPWITGTYTALLSAAFRSHLCVRLSRGLIVSLYRTMVRCEMLAISSILSNSSLRCSCICAHAWSPLKLCLGVSSSPTWLH